MNSVFDEAHHSRSIWTRLVVYNCHLFGKRAEHMFVYIFLATNLRAFLGQVMVTINSSTATWNACWIAANGLPPPQPTRQPFMQPDKATGCDCWITRAHIQRMLICIIVTLRLVRYMVWRIYQYKFNIYYTYLCIYILNIGMYIYILRVFYIVAFVQSYMMKFNKLNKYRNIFCHVIATIVTNKKKKLILWVVLVHSVP